MRIFGYPLHPMLVHFPIAFWVGANACDALALGGFAEAGRIGWLLLAAGTGIGVVTAGAGLLEFMHIEESAVPAVTRHMLTMGSAWCAYLAALLTRAQGEAPATLSIALAALGLVLMIAGGHMGATLVYGLGVGRRRDVA